MASCKINMWIQQATHSAVIQYRLHVLASDVFPMYVHHHHTSLWVCIESVMSSVTDYIPPMESLGRLTLGDRAFPVAASTEWNTMKSYCMISLHLSSRSYVSVGVPQRRLGVTCSDWLTESPLPIRVNSHIVFFSAVFCDVCLQHASGNIVNMFNVSMISFDWLINQIEATQQATYAFGEREQYLLTVGMNLEGFARYLSPGYSWYRRYSDIAHPPYSIVDRWRSTGARFRCYRPCCLRSWL